MDPESSLDFESDLIEHIFSEEARERLNDVREYNHLILPRDMWFEVITHIGEKPLRAFGCVCIHIFLLCIPVIYRHSVIEVPNVKLPPFLPPWLGYKVSNIKQRSGNYQTTRGFRRYFLSDSSSTCDCLYYMPTFAEVFQNAGIDIRKHTDGTQTITVVTPEIWDNPSEVTTTTTVFFFIGKTLPNGVTGWLFKNKFQHNIEDWDDWDLEKEIWWGDNNEKYHDAWGFYYKLLEVINMLRMK